MKNFSRLIKYFSQHIEFSTDLIWVLITKTTHIPNWGSLRNSFETEVKVDRKSSNCPNQPHLLLFLFSLNPQLALWSPQWNRERRRNMWLWRYKSLPLSWMELFAWFSLLGGLPLSLPSFTSTFSPWLLDAVWCLMREWLYGQSV